MARTFEDIKAQMIAEKEAKIPQLTTTSSTGIWLMWINVVALAIFTFEQIFEKDKAALIDLTERRRYGTTAWYASEIKKFQYGHQLVFNSQTGMFYYEIDEPDARIVVQSAVSEDSSSGMLTVKVAQLVNDDLAPLTSLQLVALNSYLELIKVAGTNVELFSLPADEINITAEVYYDGNLILDDVKSFILDALMNFRNDAVFNGVVLRNDLIRVILSPENGVYDVYFTDLTGKTSVSSPQNITRSYDTLSGYFVFAPDFMNDWTFIPKHV
jgi:hypothetical protein